MAHNFSDTFKRLQQTVEHLQNDYDKMKEKVDEKQFESHFSDDIAELDGIDKRLEAIEGARTQNMSRMRAVLQMVETLSQKLDRVSATILESKDKIKIRKEISTLELLNSENKDDTPTLPLTDEECRLQTSENESQRHTLMVTKKTQVMQHKSLNQIQSLQNSMDNSSSKSNSDSETVEGAKSHKTLIPKTLVGSDKKLEKAKQNLTKTLRSGYKVCVTEETDDNRVCFRQESECYQGTLRQSAIKCSDKPNQPAPNIFRKQGGLFDDTTTHTHKASEIMTMAQMAEREYESKQNLHSLSEWAHIANQVQMEVALKTAMNRGQKSRGGHDYLLLLDTSGSMQGEKFDLMIRTSLDFIEGLQRNFLQYGVHDNVGLASFGEDTKLILQPSTNYDDLKRELRKLQPRGTSPLAAGLLMALSGTSLCGSTIEEYHFRPCVILLTDGMATHVEAPTENDNILPFSSPMLQELLMHHELESVLDSTKHRVQVVCVPFGSSYIEVVNMLVRKTNGKIVPHTQIDRLSRMTLNILDAIKVAKNLESATDVNRVLVKQAIVNSGFQDHDLDDDVTDIVLMLLDPSSNGRFRKTRWLTLPLGSRVRRGPHWHWNNQDSNMAGTVIGEDLDDGTVWVEWDSGYKNCYTFSENLQESSLKVVNEPRSLVDALIAVGCKVKRGNSWKYGEQDGGNGSRGTVLRVKANGKVVVYWDRGRLGTYRFDENEIEVCDDGQTISSNSSHLIEAETLDSEPKSTEDMPLILPTHNTKDVLSNWQYQDEGEQWTSYDEDTNFKVEKAFKRNPRGKCIIEIDTAIYQVIFSKMVQQNNKDKSEQPVRRLEKDEDDDSPTNHSTYT